MSAAKMYTSCSKWQSVAAYVILSFVCSAMLTSAQEPTPLTSPVRGHSYPVHIGAEHHMVQGRISSEARVGTLVSSNVIMEGEEDADLTVHLRVEIRDSQYKRPHVFHPDIFINTTDPENPQFEHPVITFPNSTLPHGMEFVVVHTNAFYITDDRYIAVNDFEDLRGDTRIHFDVLLKDKLSETPYVSNSLPFVVEIEYPRVEANPNAALFAGVLIMTILVISLVIPFGVRARRRHKAGKPICGCGSAEDTSDSDSMGSQPDFVKNRSMSVGGKDNLAMMLDHSRMMNTRPSEAHLHRTIQNRMVRSESVIHFQPQWMDPHLSDYYHRPDFSHMDDLHQYHLEQQQQQQQKSGTLGSGGRGYNANSSSTSPRLPNGNVNGLPPQTSPGMLMAPAYHGNGYMMPNGGYVPAGGPGSNGRFPNGTPINPDFMNHVNMRRNSASLGNLALNGGHFSNGMNPYISNNGNGNNNNNGSYGGGGASISRGNSFSNGTTNGLAFFRAPRGMASNRSSSNSLYTYPANFNQGIEIPMSKLNKQQASGEANEDSGANRHDSNAANVKDTNINDPPKHGASNGVADTGNDSNGASSPSDSGYLSGVTKGVTNEAFQPDDPGKNQDKDKRPEVEDERL